MIEELFFDFVIPVYWSIFTCAISHDSSYKLCYQQKMTSNYQRAMFNTEIFFCTFPHKVYQCTTFPRC